ncbi:MAG TPA: acetolactate decarboxylase [Anaerolineae bacterium]|nr:acetolactate decarboxylase [Anaerolineae bacterium]
MSSTPTPDPSRVYLCAPINALVEGIYEEKIPFTEIKKHGDLGLGTFDDLDGEMVMLDGNIYQITADGSVHVIDPQALTPFACVTFYSPLAFDDSTRAMNYAEFSAWLLSLLPSPNIFYALRIEGTFPHIKARSVPKQHNYRPLVQVTKNEPIFNFYNIQGTLAGFFTPSFLSSLNVPGLHLHFLSADRTQGGHLLECETTQVRAHIQICKTLELAFPTSLDYLTADLQRDPTQDLNKAEK